MPYVIDREMLQKVHRFFKVGGYEFKKAPTPRKEIPKKIRKGPEKLMESNILDEIFFQHSVSNLIGPKLNFTKLYAGTQDGFGVNECHDKIDDKGATLCIIKTDTNKVFGGYTPIKWGTSAGYIRDQGKSFLFSIRPNNSVIKLEHNHKNGVEVTHSLNYLICFYNGLYIKPNCNVNGKSFTILTDYQKPSNVDQRSDDAQFFLNHGKKDFKVAEFEVFLVTLDES